MVNDAVTTARELERAMLLLHVDAATRPAVAALLALDDRLGEVFAGGRDAMLRRIRLTWWRDALDALDAAPPPAEPVLTALAKHVLPHGVTGAQLSRMAEGWAGALDGDDRATLDRFASMVGDALFRSLAKVLHANRNDDIATMGEGWALAHLARLARGGETRAVAAALAVERLEVGMARRWPWSLRPLAMLAAVARSDLAGGTPNTPARAALLWRVRLFGR